MMKKPATTCIEYTLTEGLCIILILPLWAYILYWVLRVPLLYCCYMLTAASHKWVILNISMLHLGLLQLAITPECYRTSNLGNLHQGWAEPEAHSLWRSQCNQTPATNGMILRVYSTDFAFWLMLTCCNNNVLHTSALILASATMSSLWITASNK